MYLHLLEFFRSQFARLVDDVLGYCEFADVMQQCRRAQRFDLVRRQANFFGDFYRVCPHALQVRVRGVILGFDG